MSAVTSGSQRKTKQKSKILNLIFEIKTYATLLDLFTSVQNS
jgi:hypothetical protein